MSQVEPAPSGPAPTSDPSAGATPDQPRLHWRIATLVLSIAVATAAGQGLAWSRVEWRTLLPILCVSSLYVISVLIRWYRREAASPDANKVIATVGTLAYTKIGLFWVFFWLLWGDFIWTLLDQNVPQILPLKLRDMGAGDTTNQALNRTLAYTIAFLFAPAVSVLSDRHRGPRGRRIPFLLWSTPFVGIFLILIGYYDSFTNAMLGSAESMRILGMEISRGTLALLVLGALFIGFDFANIFANTIYWYLFNDVVPEKFITRFYALFRMVGLIASAIYNKIIFPSSLTHFRLIFGVAGICYVIGFVIMCVKIKEGGYPAPAEDAGKTEEAAVHFGSHMPALVESIVNAVLGSVRRLLASIKTFGKECFTHRFYWYFFLTSCFMFMSYQSAPFFILRNRDSLHMNMDQIGDLAFWNNAVAIIVVPVCGWYADKFHPIRIFILATFICLLQPLLQCIWIFTDFGPQGNLTGQYIIALAILPFGQVRETTEIPMYMRLLPKDRYGQFCAANAMIRSFAMIFGSLAAGMMMEALEKYAHMDAWRYRYYSLWALVWQIPSVICLLLLYREWKRLGGDKAFKPPEAGA
ncbi:MAG TPA: MFS transporter [Planctomycetota bacterium]|jgi:hypothetical protein